MLAKAHGASITLLHVSDLPANVPADAWVTPPGERDPVRMGAFVTRGTTRRLEAVADALRNDGVSVRTQAETGDVVQEILRVAQTANVDAIVMGTHGRQGLSHLLLGSVAEKVLRAAAMPVVTIRAHAPEARATDEERAAEDELGG